MTPQGVSFDEAVGDGEGGRYDHAIREFVSWYCSEPRIAFNRSVVLRYRIHLEQRGFAPATINLRLAAVRRIGVRLGNWLTPEQGRRLLESAAPSCWPCKSSPFSSARSTG